MRERRAIEDMLNAKVPVSRIAAEIGRHRSTIYREIERNAFRDDELPYLSGYYGVTAQRSAEARRARRRKLVRLEDLRDAVILQLKEGWSPEQNAGRLGFEGRAVRVTDTNMPLIELLQKHDEGDFLRAVTEAVLQTLMEHDVEGLIDTGEVSDHELKTICDRLNTTPRKCLEWKTHAEVFREKIMAEMG